MRQAYSLPSDIKRPQISAFDLWVADNNPAPELECGKDFWNCVELVRELVLKFDGHGERVVGTYLVRRPPPEEEVLMAAVAFEVGTVSLALKYDFGADAAWPFEWTVSVKRRAPYRGPLFGLLSSATDVVASPVPGFGAEWSLPSYRNDHSSFTCQLQDDWDVATLIRLASHEA